METTEKIEKLTKKRDDLQTKIKGRTVRNYLWTHFEDLKTQQKRDSSKTAEAVALRKEIKDLKRKALKLKEATQLTDNIETAELQKSKADQEKIRLVWIKLVSN